MVIKGYFMLPSSAELDPNNPMQLSLIHRTHFFRGFYFSIGDTVSVFLAQPTRYCYLMIVLTLEGKNKFVECNFDLSIIVSVVYYRWVLM